MSLQYLETLKALGSGQATKIVIPMEFTSMLQPLLTLASSIGAAPDAEMSPNSPPVLESNGHSRHADAPSIVTVGQPDQA